MPRTRHSSRKAALSQLVRQYNTPGFYHDLLGTTEYIRCDVNDYVSVYGCPCSSRVVNHADDTRDSILQIPGAAVEVSASSYEQEGSGSPVAAFDIYDEDTVPLPSPVSVNNSAACYKPARMASSAEALPDFPATKRNLVRIRSIQDLSRRLRITIVHLKQKEE